MGLEPDISKIGEPYWNAAAEHTLTVQECRRCGALQMYPDYVCRQCFGRSLGWRPVSGQGIVYSYTIQERGVPGRAAPGTVLAIVELDEGPRLCTNIVGDDASSVSIGARVRVGFQDTGNVVLPVFTLAS